MQNTGETKMNDTEYEIPPYLRKEAKTPIEGPPVRFVFAKSATGISSYSGSAVQVGIDSDCRTVG